MNVPHHLIRLYVKTSRRYNKLISKLHRHSLSVYQRKTFLSQIRKVGRTLRGLHAQLRIAAAAGTVALTLNATSAHAQTVTSNTLGPFVLHNRLTNPLREPIITGEQPALAAVDFDGDGDVDIVVGEYHWYSGGRLRYFENQSVQGKELYLERSGEENPFKDINATSEGVAPAFADVDGDGDLDLFLGQNGYPAYNESSSRGIEYYRNDGGIFSRQTGAWDEGTKTGNPFDGLSLGEFVRPVFVDFDKDGDQDVLIGSQVYNYNPPYNTDYIHYYENNGSGTFSRGAITLDTDPNAYNTLSPALADIDGDGDYDMVLGSYNYGRLMYYEQLSPGNFSLEDADWDPVAKTGNPFSGFELGSHISPVFADFDRDGKPDLFVADEESYYGYKYSDNIINYYRNAGEGAYIEKDEFENPFDGVYVKQDAAPVFIDVDGDTDLDAVIGNKYQEGYYDENGEWLTRNSYLTYYRRSEDAFSRIAGTTNPFDTLDLYGNFVPRFIDVDADGDKDLISGNGYGEIVTFLNDNGIYREQEVASTPFAEITSYYDTSATLEDIDNDGDQDLFVSDANAAMRYFRNTGTAQTPVYTELLEAENPLMAAGFFAWSTAYFNFTDLDHDGDVDLTFNGASPFYSEQPAVLFMENTGTKESPLFEAVDGMLFREMQGDSKVTFVDHDGDGDLDAFAGISDGVVNFLENQNIKVITTVTEAVVRYDSGNEDAVLIEPLLTVDDPDNDMIVQATVSIGNHQAGEILGFTPQPGIDGVFDHGSGMLTFHGKATAAEYQALLRTVTFEVGPSGERRRPTEKSIIAKTISFAVFDQDFTNPQVAAKNLEIFVNDAPVVNAHALNVVFGGDASVDLKQIISDPNGAADLDLASLKVVQGPASGAATTIDANGILTIDYAKLVFTGTETVTLEVCDASGACAQNLLTVTVTNNAPVISPQPVTVVSGEVVIINLVNITSDEENNLDHNAFSILADPASGASATINIVSSTEVNLVLNYAGNDFQGTDQVTIAACDAAGACSQSVLPVTVTNSPPVIAPEPVSTAAGSAKAINLMNITSDVDNNLDPNAFTILAAPVSGAAASIVVVSPTEVNLLLDYEGISFSGTDQLTVRACDRAGACSENALSIEVDVISEIIVYNAVAPNSSGDNRFMRIAGLPSQNKVRIFNRWGDKVYEVENYRNDPAVNAFMGLNNNGSALPSGTYFYTIDIPDQKMISGYLTLKQ